MQRRAMSAVEATTGTVVGFGVSWVLTMTVLPAFGFDVSGGTALSITAIYTAASIVRGYIIRRAFNG